MLEALVITLREGIEVSLALGIVITYLQKSGRPQLLPWVWSGFGAAVLASVAAAFALPHLPINPELFEGVVLWSAAALVATMVVWMHFTARGLKREIEEKLEAIASRPAGTGAALAAAAFAFLMVFREGAEMVLFLSAINLSTESFMGSFGGLLGLALAAVFGLAFIRGSVRVDLGKFFQVTEIALAIFVVQLVIGGYHELSEAGVVPTSPEAMRLVGPLVANHVFFLLALLALPLLIWLLPGQREQRMAREVEALSGADRRRVLARMRRDRRWRLAAGGLAGVAMVLLTVGHVYASQGRTLSPATPVTAVEGYVAVPVQDLEDGKLVRMSLDVDGVPVRFFALKTGPEAWSAALDACDMCGAFGYAQEGPQLTCMNCSAEINPVTVGQPGGCNPAPLPSKVEGGVLRVAASDVAAGRGRFAGGATAATLPCPVCGMQVEETAAVAVGWGGGTARLCTMPECRTMFEADPRRFAP